MFQGHFDLDTATPVQATAIPDLLFERGLYWASGRSGVVNLVAAHKWFNLAALKGRSDALSLRREVAEMMSADAELDSLPLNSAHTIEILEFCADEEIDAGVYVKGAYYLEPEAVGAKPYTLLRAALSKTKRVAVGKIALRDREHLCRLALHGDGIMLNTLHWPDEIRDAGELSIPAASDDDVHARELEMAVMLIDNLAAHFDPARYRDAYRDAVLAVVEAKLANQPLAARPNVAAAKVTDLMAALKASVEQSAQHRKDSEADTGVRTAARRRKVS